VCVCVCVVLCVCVCVCVVLCVCVCVCSLSYPTRKADGCAILSSVAFLALQYFSTLSPKSTIFKETFLKYRVFRKCIMTVQELKQTIVDEGAAIDEDLRRRVYGNFQTRLQQ